MSTSTIEFIEHAKEFREKLGISKRFTFDFGFKKITRPTNSEFKMILKGHASTSDLDRQGDIITREALKSSLNDLLQKGSNTVLYNHDRNKPIGCVLATELDEKGLVVTVGISSARDVKSIRTKIRDKTLNSLSIGGKFKKIQIDRDEEGKIIAFKVLKMELYEVSVVSVPANPEADIFSVVEKMYRGEETKMDGETKKKEEEAKKKEEEAKKAAEEKKKADEEAKKAVEEVKKDPPIAKEDIKKMIDESINPISEAIKTIQESIKNLKPVENKTSTEIPQWAKDLSEKVDKLANQPSRKGVTVPVDDTVAEPDEPEVPEKALVGIEDDKTVKYVKYVMTDGDAYEKLTKEEKSVAKGIYFQLFHKRVTRK